MECARERPKSSVPSCSKITYGIDLVYCEKKDIASANSGTQASFISLFSQGRDGFCASEQERYANSIGEACMTACIVAKTPDSFAPFTGECA